jgi:hypothetical protein
MSFENQFSLSPQEVPKNEEPFSPEGLLNRNFGKKKNSQERF